MSFEVILHPSGQRFKVAESQTVLQAGLAAGYQLPYSCRTGVCRTCKVRVLEGEVDQGFVFDAYLPAQEREQGYALICSAKARSNLKIEVAELEGANIQPKLYPARVVKLERLAPDVMVITLRMPMNENMRFLAGQYVAIQLPDGETRNYSIANSPEPLELPHIELHVRHLPGGKFTDRLFTSLRERDVLKFEAPLGTFFMRDSVKPMLLLASGTGFAPIKSIVEDAIRRKIDRTMFVYWGGRTKSDLYMLDYARSWSDQHPNINFTPVLSNETAECEWTGRGGFVHQAAMQDFPDMSGMQAYACGAPVVVDAARRDFTESCGLPADQFFADSFLTAKERASSAITSDPT